MKMSNEEIGGLSATLTVRRLAPGDAAGAARWDAFIEACAGATFFHKAGWQTIVGDIFGHQTYFLYAERAGVIEGVLPLGHVNSLLFGKALVSLPFAVYGGVAASTPEAIEVLEREAQAIARQIGVDHLELRNREEDLLPVLTG